MFRWNDHQLEKLSELFLDIAKGLFLASFVVPAISTLATLINSVKTVVVATLFTYMSLKIVEFKKEVL